MRKNRGCYWKVGGVECVMLVYEVGRVPAAVKTRHTTDFIESTDEFAQSYSTTDTCLW